jgi:hypothetical protein
MKLNKKLREYSKAKTEVLIEREHVCGGCNRSDKPLSVSHTISRKRCEEIGKPELYFDKDNLELMCYGGYGDCHEIWESKNKKKMARLLNWDRMMLFVKKNDIELFNSILYLSKNL